MSIYRDYYKTVEQYHRVTEESHKNQVFGADLLFPYLAASTKRVLDVAGGTGFNAEFLRIAAVNYFCVDLSFLGLRTVKERDRGNAIQADAAQLPLRNNSVDMVLCSWSLEHFPNPRQILEEMVRVVRPHGRVIIWGPNWDNIFRKDFPQLVHKTIMYRQKVRWRIFLRMLANEFSRFQYKPFTTLDVAALADPQHHLAYDSDAMHCVLCQETHKFFQQKEFTLIHMSDFSEMQAHVRNDIFIRIVRGTLKPFLPALKRMPLVRWFVIRFPIVVEKP